MARQSNTQQTTTGSQDTQSLDQKRAAFALRLVLAAKNNDNRGNYRAYIRNLPMLIITNGLGQALAFELAGTGKKNESVSQGHALVLDHICQWLTARNGWPSSPYKARVQQTASEPPAVQLLQALCNGSEANMLRTQHELMAYLKWLKKFAEAMLPKDEEKG